MKSILEQLYMGNIYPDELIIPKNPEYRVLSRRISDILAMLKEKLSEDAYEQLERLLDLRLEVNAMEKSESFVYGFRLGASMMMEVLAEREELVLREN